MKAARTLITKFAADDSATLKGLADGLFALKSPKRDAERSPDDVWNDAEDTDEPRTVWDEIDRALDDGTLTAAEHATLGDIYDRQKKKASS